MYAKWKKKTNREVGAVDADDDSRNVNNKRLRPNFRYNNKVPDELKSASEIRKLRAEKADNKLKNMSKEKRRQIEKVNRKKKLGLQMKARENMPGKRSSKMRAIVKY
jgi:hypothetical protein